MGLTGVHFTALPFNLPCFDLLPTLLHILPFRELFALPFCFLTRAASRTLSSINTADLLFEPPVLDSSFCFYIIHLPVLLKSTKH